MAKMAATWCAWWICLAAFYVLLVGQIKGAEVGAGIICGAIAATAYTLTKSKGKLNFSFRLSWMRHLVNLPGKVLSETWAVFAALWRTLVLRQPATGRFLTIPFDYGGQDPTSAMRRSLVAAAVSFAPNTYVVSVDKEEGLLLLHQLVPSPETPGKGDREWPL